jgi:peptidase M1-like protein
VRALAICAVLAGCGQPDGAAGPRATTPAPAAAGQAETRLPDGVTPTAYDLMLELDPDLATFTGRVAIAVALDAPTQRLALHAVDLAIGRAVLRGAAGDEPVRVTAAGPQQIALVLPRIVGPGPVTLAIDYTGRVTDMTGRYGKDQQGLFRERTGGRWYLYSQAESVFARRIAPCFDEPRWKPAWRVRVIAPRDQVALGNAPPVGDAVLPDGRREVRFAEVAAMPSYLVAVAVGPFELVDAGRLGRARIPVRFAVGAGDGRRTAAAVHRLPAVIDALERYVDAPLPLAKLDFVAVPQFFGAMENPGLVTMTASTLSADFIEVAAHELAHQWFGDSVTPVWWDQLWLSEAFASWLGDKVTTELGAAPHGVLAHESRAAALDADDAIDARPLIHPIASSAEVEPAFDALAYDKGAAVLAMFERLVGPDVFQAAVRRYLTEHARTAVTSRAFLDALAAASRPEVAAALGANLAHAGTPVVELSVRCDAAPVIVAAAPAGVAVPVCVRVPSQAAAPEQRDAGRACFLAGARSEQPLPAGAACPAWIIGNDGGVGYYRSVLRGVAAAPVAAMSPEERLARGDDAAIAVRRGELPVAAALDELATLAADHELYGELAALAVAAAIDALVPDAARPAWTAWLAARFSDRMTRDALLKVRTYDDYVVRRGVIAIVRDRIDPDIARAARAEYERGGAVRDPQLIRIAAARDPDTLFAALVDSASQARRDEVRAAALAALGDLPAPFAGRIVDLLLDRRFPAARVWQALAAMLGRGETRSAAWRALHGRFASVIAALGPGGARDAIAALSVLCDPGARRELARDATAQLAAIDDGRRTADRTLAVIDRCIARRAAAGAGDIAAALARPSRSGL